MNQILSPYPLLKINITIDPPTGTVNCDASLVPIPLLIQTFASLISQYIQKMVMQEPQKPGNNPNFNPSDNFKLPCQDTVKTDGTT